jgi:hypothetical protein
VEAVDVEVRRVTEELLRGWIGPARMA